MKRKKKPIVGMGKGMAASGGCGAFRFRATLFIDSCTRVLVYSFGTCAQNGAAHAMAKNGMGSTLTHTATSSMLDPRMHRDAGLTQLAKERNGLVHVPDSLVKTVTRLRFPVRVHDYHACVVLAAPPAPFYPVIRRGERCRRLGGDVAGGACVVREARPPLRWGCDVQLSA